MAAGHASFPRSRRLISATDYARVFAQATRSSDRYFTLLARCNDEHRPRLGLAISRRAASRAVDRNKLKRLARETFRTCGTLPDNDYVLMAKPAAIEASNAILRKSLQKHFKRIEQRMAGQADG